MSAINVDQVLSEMRRITSVAQGGISEAGAPAAIKGGDFSTILEQSINKVNETQKTAGAMANSFSAGNTDADLGQVMVALQKASVSFQAMTQVRNKLVSAYQEVMSMQV